MTTQEAIKTLKRMSNAEKSSITKKLSLEYAIDCLAQLENQLATVTAERAKAVEFIRYLDKQYSGYMSEEDRFSKWRGLVKDGEINE